MNLSRAELRKILYEFNSISSRLLQADFRDYAKVAAKFIDYVKSVPIIYDYILGCGTCDQNMEKEFDEVSNSFGRCIFNIGKTDDALVLIRHIEGYLTKIGIDMGVDERVVYSISNNGQVNIASDNGTINAPNYFGVDVAELGKLIEDVKKSASGMAEKDRETLSDSLEVIDEQFKTDKPKKSFVRAAIEGIKRIKWTAEFAAAVAALVQFVQTVC